MRIFWRLQCVSRKNWWDFGGDPTHVTLRYSAATLAEVCALWVLFFERVFVSFSLGALRYCSCICVFISFIAWLFWFGGQFHSKWLPAEISCSPQLFPVTFRRPTHSRINHQRAARRALSLFTSNRFTLINAKCVLALHQLCMTEHITVIQ